LRLQKTILKKWYEINMKNFKIKKFEAEQRLDVFLAEKMGMARAQAQKLVKAGQILVSDKQQTAHYVVREGDVVIMREAKKQKNKKTNTGLPQLTIVSETNDYLVINKSAGVIVHGGRGIVEPTLADALEQKYPALRKVGDDPGRPGIVHRLDKEVSGLMVIATTQAMFESLKEQFQARTVTKKYLALAYGAIAKERDEITFAIARSAKGYKMASLPVGQDGRRAVTEIFVKQKFINYTLLDVAIKTGRTHQIRVHLAAYGHPLVGDDLYGTRKTKALNKKVALGRVWLHAYELGFTDLQNQRREFIIALPKELKDILQQIK
jgi:23S rRNA pseudouridine1911/1915/1917 synthase